MISSPPKVLVELRPSRIHVGGVGVFAACDIQKGQKVAEGIPVEEFQRPVPWEFFYSYDEEFRRKVKTFCVGTPNGFIPPPDLDFNKLSIDWYLNHSCDGNCGFDKDGDFVAIRDIESGEELAYDYGLAESNPAFLMECNCGSANCRRMITGSDWKTEAFIAKNRDCMHPHLRRLVLAPA